jgi:hypothetical protein
MRLVYSWAVFCLTNRQKKSLENVVFGVALWCLVLYTRVISNHNERETMNTTQTAELLKLVKDSVSSYDYATSARKSGEIRGAKHLIESANEVQQEALAMMIQAKEILDSLISEITNSK